MRAFCKRKNAIYRRDSEENRMQNAQMSNVHPGNTTPPFAQFKRGVFQGPFQTTLDFFRICADYGIFTKAKCTPHPSRRIWANQRAAASAVDARSAKRGRHPLRYVHRKALAAMRGRRPRRKARRKCVPRIALAAKRICPLHRNKHVMPHSASLSVALCYHSPRYPI